MNHAKPGRQIKQQLKQADALLQRGELARAQMIYQQLLAADPYNSAALEGLGLLLGQAGRLEEALNCFSRATIASPNAASLHFNCGKVLKDLGRIDEALRSFEQAIALEPKFAEAHDSRAMILNRLGRYEEALAAFDRAIASKTSFARAYNNRGALLSGHFKRQEEALADFNRAIALKPDFGDAWYNRGHLHHESGHYEAAARDYDRALRLNPGSASVHYNLALLKLLLGDYEEGWALYEWRWQTRPCNEHLRHFSQPLWLGETPLAGKTLLLHAEQGFGDTLQMVRYLPQVAALGAKIILELPAVLAPLMESLDAPFTLIEKGQALPPFDLHCPLMSLPLAFKSTLATLPAATPYLSAEPQRQAQVAARLGPKTKPRIGLVWSGNPNHLNDANRSLPLSSLEPLMGLVECDYHSLQKEYRAGDAETMKQWPQLHDHAAELSDYAATAALVAELDLVISVDTSVAHLAGAMGRPVWLLLPHVADFRWLTVRDDSPWYPTARLFRQERNGDWDGVVSAVRQALQSHLSQPH